MTTLAVGLFAIGEALHVASRHLHKPEKPIPVKGSIWMTRETGGVPGRPGCAARRSAFRSAHCRPAARKFRPF
ncbi:Tricarboxylate transport membrane protein TctA (plasmid) [Sinorhizobium fredii CCBAU 83666]|nr:Tricarboxylate transport membrane protein TctA [Sinorhizobium fredii CCBAU 83666]